MFSVNSNGGCTLGGAFSCIVFKQTYDYITTYVYSKLYSLLVTLSIQKIPDLKEILMEGAYYKFCKKNFLRLTISSNQPHILSPPL